MSWLDIWLKSFNSMKKCSIKNTYAWPTVRLPPTPDSQKHETHFIFKFVVVFFIYLFFALRFLGSCLRIFLHDTCELRGWGAAAVALNVLTCAWSVSPTLIIGSSSSGSSSYHPLAYPHPFSHRVAIMACCLLNFHEDVAWVSHLVVSYCWSGLKLKAQLVGNFKRDFNWIQRNGMKTGQQFDCQTELKRGQDKTKI